MDYLFLSEIVGLFANRYKFTDINITCKHLTSDTKKRVKYVNTHRLYIKRVYLFIYNLKEIVRLLASYRWPFSRKEATTYVAYTYIDFFFLNSCHSVNQQCFQRT